MIKAQFTIANHFNVTTCSMGIFFVMNTVTLCTLDVYTITLNANEKVETKAHL